MTWDKVSFKQNILYKSCCTQKGTSNGDLEIVLNYYLIFICFTNALPIITYCFSFIEHTQQEIIHSIRSDTLYSLNRIS